MMIIMMMKMIYFIQIVVGLGSPIEGTGAMEALAHGSVFINPRYTGDAQDIFKSGSKPTQRLVS